MASAAERCAGVKTDISAVSVTVIQRSFSRPVLCITAIVCAAPQVCAGGERRCCCPPVATRENGHEDHRIDPRRSLCFGWHRRLGRCFGRKDLLRAAGPRAALSFSRGTPHRIGVAACFTAAPITVTRSMLGSDCRAVTVGAPLRRFDWPLQFALLADRLHIVEGLQRLPQILLEQADDAERDDSKQIACAERWPCPVLFYDLKKVVKCWMTLSGTSS